MSGIIGGAGSKSGVINDHNYAFNAYLSANQEVSSASNTKVDFDTVKFGASYWSASNQRLDVPKTGNWLISYNIKTVDSVYWVAYKFKVDGTFIHQGWTMSAGLNGITCQANPTNSFSDIIKLTAGTYLELWFHPHQNFTLHNSDSDNTDTTTAASWISGHYIGI